MRDGSTSAGNDLAQRYYETLSSYYRRRLPSDDAEDLTQATLMETVGRVERFRNEATFRHYVFCVAKRIMAERRRQLSRRIVTEPTPSSEPAALDTSLSERVARAEHLELAREALEGLEEHYQIVLLMHLHGATNHEIADALGIRYNTVRSRLSRALANVRRELAPISAEILGRDAERRAQPRPRA